MQTVEKLRFFTPKEVQAGNVFWQSDVFYFWNSEDGILKDYLEKRKKLLMDSTVHQNKDN